MGGPHETPGTGGEQQLIGSRGEHRAAELPGGRQYNAFEMDGREVKPELPGGGINNAHEKP